MQFLSQQVKPSLIACEVIINALIRQESGGAHRISDFPDLDDEG